MPLCGWKIQAVFIITPVIIHHIIITHMADGSPTHITRMTTQSGGYSYDGVRGVIGDFLQSNGLADTLTGILEIPVNIDFHHIISMA